MRAVAVLFAMRGSVYHHIPGCDVYDIERDARTWRGGCPVIAHPPCRSWGRLRTFAQPRADERELAVWSVEQVRRWGGVLEHPSASKLWDEVALPPPGSYRDKFGGWTLPISQRWWGHPCEKRTLLYIVGIRPRDMPPYPLDLAAPLRTVQSLHSDDSERTPPELACWLVDLAAATHRTELAA